MVDLVALQTAQSRAAIYYATVAITCHHVTRWADKTGDVHRSWLDVASSTVVGVPRRRTTAEILRGLADVAHWGNE